MVMVVGHRGAAGLAPENTLGGFRLALELGVDAVECDVRLTRDGHVVLCHDPTVDRTTDGSGLVAELDLRSIRRLDAGGGERVPLLAELLELLKGRCLLLCELKAEEVTAPAVEVVLNAGMAAEVIFISFRPSCIAKVHSYGQSLRTGVLFGAPRAKALEDALDWGVEYVGAQYKYVCLASVAKARQAGIRLGAWTPNEPEELKAMLALGVDVITTDRPDVLLKLLDG